MLEALPEGIVRTPMGAYVLREDSHLSRWVERENRLDVAVNIDDIRHYAHLIPEGSVVINAGACLGDHTVTYSQIVGAHGCVFAFEPHPLTYAALALNTKRMSNVVTFRCGLSENVGQAMMHLDPNIGASYVSPDGTAEVRLDTLDAVLLGSLQRCDLIHLDAEGMEPAILRGGRQIIEKFFPLLVLEVCPGHLTRAGFSERELLTMLLDWGYTIYPLPGHGDPALQDVYAIRDRA